MWDSTHIQRVRMTLNAVVQLFGARLHLKRDKNFLKEICINTNKEFTSLNCNESLVFPRLHIVLLILSYAPQFGGLDYLSGKQPKDIEASLWPQ